MAGVFGLFDFTKEGAGVGKGGPEKKRFFYFFELFFRKFWRICQVNLIFMLFCLPALALGYGICYLLKLPIILAVVPLLFVAGPASCGMTFVLKKFVHEEPVFMFSDFMEAFCKNWKQSIPYSIICGIITMMIIVSALFYFSQLSSGGFTYVLFGITILIAFIFSMMNFFIYDMIVTVDLKLKDILKNAFIFSVLGFKTNICTLLFAGGILALLVLYYPVTALPIILFGLGVVAFIVVYNSDQYLYKYIVNPYYESQGVDLDAPKEETESIFNDNILLKDKQSDSQ